MRSLTLAACLLALFLQTQPAIAETLRNAVPLNQRLLDSDPAYLAQQARLRGDARRGALVFFRSAAACANCHGTGNQATALGPDLSRLGKVTDVHVIESLLRPSKSIREEYQTVSFLMEDGSVRTGMVAGKTDDFMIIREASDLSLEVKLPHDEIEFQKASDQSMMPEGLAGSLTDQRDFFDVVRYVMEIAAGGPVVADSLRPSPEQLAIVDDSADLDHRGIIQGLRSRDLAAGKAIYHGYCFNCHGSDGNTPSLPTARAFGSQKLKFGSDPYRMFMTLTRGNGLMAPMSHLTPKERYQVVHYIRESMMKPANEDYFKVDEPYLATLPKGTKDGTEVTDVDRDFGPALASQLRRDFSSVLTVQVGEVSLSYDLHTMNQAGIWRDGFLDLSNTQHVRGRGEGTANPKGTPLVALNGWQWGHEGSLDYPTDHLLPRGPMPKKWMDYHGHYLHGDQLVLSYQIDGRLIKELPAAGSDLQSICHHLEIGPGEELILAAIQADPSWTNRVKGPQFIGVGNGTDELVIAGISGDIDGMKWSIDHANRLCLKIPAGQSRRQICVHRHFIHRPNLTTPIGDFASKFAAKTFNSDPQQADFQSLTSGGPLLWPEELTTKGQIGLQQGAYKLDTLTIPDSTPWNTWFRTSALDFFDDGRMALATHGGDIWVVSGIDKDLLNLRWKRFAGGLYEPFGVKIVDDQIYVTCKDRLTRLHDLNGNGEADFYESFCADQDVSVNFHAFNFDLQTDNEGNFYYAKSGHGTDSDVPGAVIKVSADGQSREIFSTGFRTPNGMGSLPDGRITVSDNQGQWTPASKINVLRPNGYYGWVANYSIPGMWEPGGGTIDLEKVVPPETFDPPLIWMPQEFDNSSGGQVWAGDRRWGPLAGRLLHTSFGKGWLYYTMIQDIGDVSQAAIIKLPFDFRTGIMRARVNPADGQVYATGLQGWNGGGRLGLLDKGIQRLRYTGEPHRMVSDCQMEPDGLRVSFNFPLDRDSATDPASWNVTHWNYKRAKSYGSEMYSPSTGEKGIDTMNITDILLGPDGKSVKLHVPKLKPVNQVHVLIDLKAADSEPFKEEIYWTINRVSPEIPGSPAKPSPPR